MEIKIDGIDHVVFFVKEYARSKKFYQDVFGLTEHHEDGPAIGFLNAGSGHALALFQKDLLPSWREGRPRFHDAREVIGGSEFNRVSFTTESGTPESVKAELESKGVKVTTKADDTDALYFEDPDGRPIRLYVGPVEYPPHPGTFA